MWCYKSPGKIFIKCHREIKEDKDFVVKKKKKRLSYSLGFQIRRHLVTFTYQLWGMEGPEGIKNASKFVGKEKLEAECGLLAWSSKSLRFLLCYYLIR